VTIQIELKFQFSFEFSARRKQIINYSRIHVSLNSLVYFYCFTVRRNMARFTLANLPKCSVTVCELCKSTYKIIELEAAVISVILRKWKCFYLFLEIVR
jgi:hypothetical protein